MSTPALSRRPPPPEALPVDPEELSLFRAWLVSRGYAELSAKTWVSRVRTAYAHGVRDPAGVTAAFPSYHRATRCSFRAALQTFDEFRRTAR